MTRGQLLQQILTQRRDRRMTGEAQAHEAMRRYVYDHPELKAFWFAFVSENIEAAKDAVRGRQGGPRMAGQRFRQALAESLAREGRSADEFVYRPLCSRCGDTGMVGEKEQHYCSCILNEAALRLREATGIRPDFSFERFDRTIFPETPLPALKGTQRQLMDLRKEQCLEFVREFPGPEAKSLLLMGGAGLGKTYLLHAVANALVDRGFTVMMATAYQLVRASLDRRENGDPLTLYNDADLLIIDDLGSEPLYQKVTVETLFALINDRMSRRLPMAFSTNLTPAEINDRYGTRMASRLLDRSGVTVLRLEGKDVRLTRR